MFFPSSVVLGLFPLPLLPGCFLAFLGPMLFSLGLLGGVRSFRCFSRPLLSWACSLCPGLPGCFLAFLGPILFSLGVSSGSGTIKDSTS